MGLQTEIALELRKDDDLLLRVGRGHWEDLMPIVIAKIREEVEGIDNPFCDEAAKDGKNDIAFGMMVGFDKGKQATLKALGKEGKDGRE